MRQIHREALVPHSPEQMFELIERVEDYPQFLPWCLSTSLIARTPDSVSATVVVGMRELACAGDHTKRKAAAGVHGHPHGRRDVPALLRGMESASAR